MNGAADPEGTSNRWRRVEALYHQMRAHPPEERASALAAACADDPALAAEVLSLLDQPEPPAGFLAAPAVEVAARLASGASSSLTGRRIGVFEVQGLLGVGGMGEVYRARDTRLGRSVAIKILPRAFKSDSERRVRFDREARVLASLSHPRICALYDVGRQGDTDYLVMELVEGETLAARLKKGPLPLEQTLRTGIEIAEGLDKAHRQGVIHRDLKPGNVMLTKSGSKLMDFGLAKLTLAGQGADSISASPTASESLTDEGMLMGTVPYMAPEQLEGKGPDARSDLWAFGCVLYEMATGRPAFEGKSRASLISAILTTVPQPITQLQPLTPSSLERLVKVCLAKDPDDRLQTAHDVMQELKWIGETPSVSGDTMTSGPFRVIAGQRRWLLGASAFAFPATLILGVILDRRLLAPLPSRPPVIRTLLSIAPAEELNSSNFPLSGRNYTPGGSSTAFTWTPDGRSLVFVGKQGGVQRIYVRALDGEQARPLEGTEGARLPALSPDGQWVAYWVGGTIRRVPVTGGPVATMVEGVAPPLSIAWGVDGRLFYGPADCGSERGVICSAAPEHGTSAVTKPRAGSGPSERHTLPHVLPDGRGLLYTVRRRSFTWGDEEVVAHVFSTGETRPLLRDAADARYVESGHLVFLRRGTLFGVRFDLSRLEVMGTAIPVTGTVSQALTGGNSTNLTGAGQFSVASTGALAWLPSEVVPYPDRNIVTIDRQGQVRPLNVQPGKINLFELSPDGRQLAFGTQTLTAVGLSIHNLGRGTLTRLQGEGENFGPRWTPDGQRVAFESLRKGKTQLLWQRVDGTSPPELLIEGGGVPSSWSPDGRELALLRNDDIWIATLAAGAFSVKPFIETPDTEENPEFSPDGQWLAYTSNASGRHEVYVQPYPGPGPRLQVSLDGGWSPAWNPSGREIFFLSLWNATKPIPDMMSVEVRPGSSLGLGKPRALFPQTGCGPIRCYAVSPDGQLFYAFEPEEATSPRRPVTQINLITNWVEELKAKVAAGQAKQP